MANTPPSWLMTSFHRKTIAAPLTIPAMAPARVVRFQNRLNRTNGPKVAPNPAHAKDTILNTELLESLAMNTAINEMIITVN